MVQHSKWRISSVLGAGRGSAAADAHSNTRAGILFFLTRPAALLVTMDLLFHSGEFHHAAAARIEDSRRELDSYTSSPAEPTTVGFPPEA